MRVKDLIIVLQVLLLVGLLSACGDDDADADKTRVKNEHFFMKEQVEAINKARAVEGMLQDHVKQEMEEADRQSQ
jgi:hypothetical protein